MTMTTPEKKDCKHLWVNQDGCLLCDKDWDTLNKEGYVFQAMEPPQPEGNKE